MVRNKLHVLSLSNVIFVSESIFKVILIFRQHAASIYALSISFVLFRLFVKKKFRPLLSEVGRRLKFGMLTVLTNIRSISLAEQCHT